MKNTQKGNLYVAAPANRGDRYGSFLASTALAMRASLFLKATPATFRGHYHHRADGSAGTAFRQSVSSVPMLCGCQSQGLHWPE
jgi:hypothetical protein